MILHGLSEGQLAKALPQLWEAYAGGPFREIFADDRRAKRAYMLQPYQERQGHEDDDEAGQERHIVLDTPQTATNLATYLVSQRPPAINLRTERDNEAERNRRQRQENMLRGIVNRNEIERGVAAYEETAFSLTLFGRTIARTLWLPDEQNDTSRFPYWIQVLPPTNIVYQEAGNKLDWVLIHTPQRLVAEIVGQLPECRAALVPNESINELTATVDFYEYTDGETMIYHAAGGAAPWTRVVEHNYRCLNYAASRARAGLLGEPGWDGTSFIRPIISEWEGQCDLLSIMATYAERVTRGVVVTKTVNGQDMDVEAYLKAGYLPLAKDEDATYLIPPPLPQGIPEVIQILQATLDKATFSSAQYGGGPLPSSGILAAYLQAGGKASLSPYVHAQARIWSQIHRINWTLASTVGRNQIIHVWGRDPKDDEYDLSIKGSEMAGLGEIEVTVTADLPQDKMGRENIGMQQVVAGVKGLETFLEEDREVPDIPRELKRIKQNVAYLSPVARQADAQEYLQRLQAKKQAEAQKLAQKLAQKRASGQPTPLAEMPVPPTEADMAAMMGQGDTGMPGQGGLAGPGGPISPAGPPAPGGGPAAPNGPLPPDQQRRGGPPLQGGY